MFGARAMSIKLQRLTEKSMEKLKDDLEKIRIENSINPTIDIKKYETEQNEDIVVDKHKIFENKLSVGKYFLHIFPENFQPDKETWNWLAIFYYKQLLHDHKKIGELQRLFISGNSQDYHYRHLLQAPYNICKFYKKNVNDLKFLLLDKVNKNGILYRRIVENSEIRKNLEFMKVARQFFYDENTKLLKKDISIRKSIERLIKVWRQYERSFDMYHMPSEQIINKLLSKHDEFRDFINKN